MIALKDEALIRFWQATSKNRRQKCLLASVNTCINKAAEK